MNFDDAIAAHSQWKSKLSTYLRKPDGHLNSTDVSVDNKCDLGKWIEGEGGQKFASLPAFGSLKAEHAKFHRAAALLVKRADAGEKVGDEVALGSDSELEKASRSVVQAIMGMKAAH